MRGRITLSVCLALLACGSIYQAALADQVRVDVRYLTRYLDQMNLKYESDADKGFAHMIMQGDHGKYDTYVIADTQNALAFIIIRHYLTVKPSSRSCDNVLRQLMHLNWTLNVGKFEWNPDDGEVRFTFAFSTEGGIDFAAFKAVFETMTSTADDKHAALEAALALGGGGSGTNVAGDGGSAAGAGDDRGDAQGDGGWEYLHKLYGDPVVGGWISGRNWQFEGAPHPDSYGHPEYAWSRDDDVWTFGSFGGRGKPKRLEMTLAVSDETGPDVVIQFQLRLDNAPPLQYNVRLRDSKRVSLSIEGVGRMELTVKGIAGHFNRTMVPLVVDPKVYF